MNKQTFRRRLFVFCVFFSMIGTITNVQASLSTSSLEISDIKWIAPNVSQIGLGRNAEFAFLPDGTMQVVYLDPEEYSDKLLFITNATGSWSSPETIADPSYGAMNPQILIDLEGDSQVSYRADGGGAFHINNSGNSWTETSMGGGQLKSFVPRMAIGPDNAVHFVYYWLESSSSSYEGGITYINSTHHEQHQTNNSITRFEQNPSIAVDSNGLVHIVFEGSWNNTAIGSIAVRDIFYQTFNPNVEEPYFSDLIRLTTVQTTKDYAERPTIICDENDNLHVVFIETEAASVNGQDVHQAYIKYMRLDNTPSKEDAAIINTLTATTSYPSIAVDSEGDVHIVFVGYPQTEFSHYYTTDIMYSTNKSGHWMDERVTNQPYSVLSPRIAINPLTDEPTILYHIKHAYSTVATTMEYVESRNGSFGTHFDVSTLLSGSEENIGIQQEEAYKYLWITPNQPILLELTLDNKYNEANDIELDINLVENDYISLVNGTGSQTLSNMAPDSSVTLQWYIQAATGSTGEIEVQITHEDEIIGKILYMYNVGSPSRGGSIGIGDLNFVFIASVLNTTILLIIQKNRK
ncbi:hypothetical protein NEF87_000936 [Candidatus Lokiarchaeum ossiferum]|uniref:Uncharacterized protein n=1 Tax=Candidatus Lokiarchaeum ossiferum TaxID=2951803 RepID=A0ABY6HMB1_9ARCH|nr:hypothetical protein NEF87_000936 [Candidatus Lokiarchaeum sp. B-35]